ncbi:MAG TPA: nitrite reductase large subunit NirB [Acidimicrobiales bacterium]|nr:nitrite reductase large subunit NirB [Acidimicrobiales bacterium]
MTRHLVVIGHGMVGQRLLEACVDRELHRAFEITVIGEEPRPAYDRVHLSAWFDGSNEEDLHLAAPGWCEKHDIGLSLGTRATAIDRVERTVTTDAGEVLRYDELVLATGSYPFVPPMEGGGAAGVFVYRTIDDLIAIEARARTVDAGVVIGGGLLGLEAANALRLLGLTTHVVEVAPRLMAVQLDDGGATQLRRKIEALGIACHVGQPATNVLADEAGNCRGLRLQDGSEIACEVVIVAAGIRPRDELAVTCGLDRGERGGFLTDERLRTSAEGIWAIGECAAAAGRCYGLVAPGFQMAEVVAEQLAGGTATFSGADLSSKLKLIGVDVASFGDAHGTAPGSMDLVYSDPRAGIYKKLVLDPAGRRVIGGMLVGDADAYGVLVEMARGNAPTPRKPEALILPAADGAAPTLSVTSLPDGAKICSCNNVSKGTICEAIRAHDLVEIPAVKACTKAGTTCGSCVPLLKDLLGDEMRKAGKTVTNHLCEHFALSRQELYDIVRVRRITSFRELIDRVGTGRGCDICKPAVASMLASLGNGYILEGEQATLQDTNDFALANLQRDGSYSIVPRVPGGEITADKLIVLGEVAKEFDLYTKITGGQRVDLFGARIDQLPLIWQRLVEAGFESGHAYGKALRTVKSCVGEVWCRYGVQDAVGLAVELELRYRGLRSPHKIKMAVSGCARECAEAQGKDVGVIATERGWNLYVCGNGGMRPQHATLLATDLDRETLIRYIDRFVAFYVRTADRLERTATWFNKLEGGVDYLYSVIVDDVLGVCDELDAQMAHHVETYECEWAATLADPDRLARFVTFVNSVEPDPQLAYVRTRGQRVPALAEPAP